MVDIPQDNPAGRLHAILQQLRRSPGSTNRPVRGVWAEVFQCEAKDTARILAGVAKVIQQIGLAKEEVRRLEGTNPELYLQPLDALERAFATFNIDQSLNSFRKLIKNTTLIALAHTAQRLSDERREQVIEAEKLDEIRVEVEDLTQQLLEAPGVHPLLRAELVRGLEKVRGAIVNYRITGSAGLQEAADQALGTFGRRWQALTGEVHKIAKRALSVIGKIYGLLKLGGAAINFLALPGGADSELELEAAVPVEAVEEGEVDVIEEGDVDVVVEENE